MRILITGASGFVGSLLVPALREQGETLRAFGRDRDRMLGALAPEDREGLEVVTGDAVAGSGLDAALAGVEVAYYLIHSMERLDAAGSFAERERAAAVNFAGAARRAGVRRVVYLGGLVPRPASAPSRHLASREEVERILLESVPDSLALRASIVIGARSRSFRLLVRLVERMPVITLPAWQRFRTAPVDERDVIGMLVAARNAPLGGESLDVGGPDVLTYGEMLERIAELMLLGRPTMRLGVTMRTFSGRVAAAIAGEDPELIGPLMEGLKGDLLPERTDVAELLGVRLHPFDAAVEHALARWERAEPLAAR